MAVIGSGWTWLLLDNSNNGKLIVTNTFNGDVPLFTGIVNHRPSTVGIKNDGNAVKSANTLLSLLTRSSMLSASSTGNTMALHCPTPCTKMNQQRVKTKSSTLPSLLINMWEHAWIPDYATNKEAYIKDCWERINWQQSGCIVTMNALCIDGKYGCCLLLEIFLISTIKENLLSLHIPSVSCLNVLVFGRSGVIDADHHHAVSSSLPRIMSLAPASAQSSVDRDNAIASCIWYSSSSHYSSHLGAAC